MTRYVADTIVDESERRMRIHDRLIAIACGYGYETDEPLTDDGIVACIRVAHMVASGVSSFTPSMFGESLSWGDERSVAAIEEIANMHVTCRVACGGTDMSVVGRVLESWKFRGVDVGGNEYVEYHVTYLSDVGTRIDVLGGR